MAAIELALGWSITCPVSPHRKRDAHHDFCIFVAMAAFGFRERPCWAHPCARGSAVAARRRSVAHPGQQLEARRRVETATAGVLVQGHPADELHGEERLAVFTHPGFIDL